MDLLLNYNIPVLTLQCFYALHGFFTLTDTYTDVNRLLLRYSNNSLPSKVYNEGNNSIHLVCL